MCILSNAELPILLVIKYSIKRELQNGQIDKTKVTNPRLPVTRQEFYNFTTQPDENLNEKVTEQTLSVHQKEKKYVCNSGHGMSAYGL